LRAIRSGKVTTVNDVTALMGKLKSTVAYLQFDEGSTEPRRPWPVLDRAARARESEPVRTVAEPATPPAAAPNAVSKPAPTLLRRYAPQAEPTPPSQPSRALVDIFAHLERAPR
jgi:hypothetical protein